MTTRSGIVLGLAAAACAVSLTPVFAADYDPPIYVDEAPEYTPVEVGSGWYLRGDLAYLPERDYDDIDFSFIGGPASGSYSNDEEPVFASIGAGYHFNDYLRAELNIGYLPGQEVSGSYDDGTIAGATSIANHAWTAMVNGYIDLGTYVGLTPYIGAGIGLFQSNHKLSASYSDAGNPADDFILSNKDTNYSFAYTLNAGLAYQLSKNLLIDVGYQYLSAPDAEYQTMESLSSYPIAKGLDYHQIKVGLRYDLW